jgi:hypothetical protein
MSQGRGAKRLAATIWSLAVVLAALPGSLQQNPVVSFLAPQTTTALPLQTLGPEAAPPGRPVNATAAPEQGVPSWGAYLTTTVDADTPTNGPTQVCITDSHHFPLDSCV